MTLPNCSATAQWYREGHCEYNLRTIKSAGRILDLLEFGRPRGDMSRSAFPDIMLCQDLLGGGRVSGNLGGGRFDVKAKEAPSISVRQTSPLSPQSSPDSRFAP